MTAAATQHQEYSGKRLKLTQASQVRARKVLFLSKEPPIPIGTLTVLAGPSGIGKTTIAESYLARLTRGTLDGVYKGKPQSVIVLSPEDDEAAITRPRLEAAGADLDKVYFMSSTRRTETGEMEAMIQFPADTPMLLEAVQRTGAAAILLDPIASVISGNLDKREDVRASFDRLAAEVAKVHQLAILLVAHNRKGVGQVRHMVSGSTAITDAARSVLAVAKDEETDSVVLAVDKSSYSTAEGMNLAYKLVSVDVPLANGQVTTVARAEYVGKSEISVAELHARHSGEEQDNDDRNAAQAFLLDYLSNKPGCEGNAGEVIKAGRASGFSDNDMKNARKRSRNPRIKTQKSKNFGGDWVWTLDYGDPEGVTKGSKGSGINTPTPLTPSVTPSSERLAPVTLIGRDQR